MQHILICGRLYWTSQLTDSEF